MAAPSELAELIDRYADGDGMHETALPRVGLIRSSVPTEPLHIVHQAAICIIAQGAKQVQVGERVIPYDAEEFLIISVDMPVVGEVTEASPEQPYLCLRLDLDPKALGQTMLDFGVTAAAAGAPPRGISLGRVTPELLDAASRLVRLLGTPGDIKALAPLAEREILYRMITAGHGPKLAQIAMADSKLGQVTRAIGWIKRHFREPFQMEEVCAAAGMSQSALHEHFRAVTEMSPLQYQKQLRLQEARRLILARAADAATAGHTVGYDSPSQFSREYRRLFGAPPMRDADRLRGRELAVG